MLRDAGSNSRSGRTKWEGRTDKSLVDFLQGELGSSYRHLFRLLCLLYMGDRNESGDVDEALAAEQVATLHEECEKGWFEDFDETAIIEIIGANTTSQNALVAQLYEKEYAESLSKALEGKCGERLHYALTALLLTKPAFIAMRLHDAMGSWVADKAALTRLLGGLDGAKMEGVCDAYEEKYDQPLWSALKQTLDGDFERAALAWVKATGAGGGAYEAFTEVDVAELEGDAAALCGTLDHLLFENDELLRLIAVLDVEVVRETTKGSGTDRHGPHPGHRDAQQALPRACRRRLP